jgi:hypothetical protein
VTALKATTVVAALAAGAALVLSGCGAGQISQTASQVAAVNGNSANIGKVALRDVRILVPSPAEGAEYGNVKGGKAVLAFSAVNTGGTVADELTSITSDLGTVKITPAGPALPPDRTLVAAGPQHGASASAHPSTAPAGESEPVLVEITGLTKDLSPGLTYPVTFNFKENGTVLVNVPVDTTAEHGRPAAEAH